MDGPSVATFAVVAGLGGWVAWEVIKARKEASAPPVTAPSYHVGNVDIPMQPQFGALAPLPARRAMSLVATPGPKGQTVMDGPPIRRDPIPDDPYSWVSTIGAHQGTGTPFIESLKR